jgi:PAS domain S-box-containing protein
MLVQKRVIFLIVIMVGLAASIGASAIFVIHHGGHERESLRLQDIVQSQARLLEAMARFDQMYTLYPEGPEAASLQQFIASQHAIARHGLGETGEIALARREGDTIVFLFRRESDSARPKAVPIDSGVAEPMRAALSGQSGTMIGKDYDGTPVLAAYEPVAVLNLGLVAKIDRSEVRARLIKAAIPVFLTSLVAVLGAAGLCFWITQPVIRQLRDSEGRFRGLFEHMKSGAAVFRALPDGSDFTFTDINRRGEQIGQIDRRNAIGRRLTEVFPGTAQFGLLDDLKEVWRSGIEKVQPPRYYRDDRLQGWRDGHVYKLPSGELVTLFDDVTEQKQAQQALKDSEVRFRGTFENAAVGIAHVGIDGSWLLVNQRLCEIVGYSRDALARKTFQEITHPDDLSADLEQFDLLLRGKIASYSMEKRYIHKDGHVVWVNLTSALQRDEAGLDEAGRPLYCISIVEDIATRKRTEQSLSESETRMRALLDASEDEILLLSIEGRILAINKAAEWRLAHRITGAEPLGANLTRFLPDDLAKKRLAIVRDVAASGNSIHVEIPIRARWFDFWFYPVRHAGQPISEVAVYAREITQRKRSETQLRRLSQAMQQSPASVVITDLDGRIVYVNPKFTEVTGYEYDEVIGRNPRILKSGHTAPDEYRELWETITSGHIWRGEFRNRKKSGELYWEIASIGPVKDEGGTIINFVAVKEDITEHRAVEAQLRQSQKMQAIGQLTGGIAHDFNNLLTIIVGNLQLIEFNVRDNETLHSFVNDALWATKRGGELTHRLLSFARMQPLRPAAANLNEIVGGLTDLLRRTLGSRIEVIEVLAPDVRSVMVDTGELERALVNLAINARDAMPAGGTLTIETGMAAFKEGAAQQQANLAPGSYVTLSVSDTGEGMPPEVVERVFEPFFTTKSGGQRSGLGLSMVYGFLRQSGGHISVQSEIGAGTTFTLYFPQAPGAGEARPAADAANENYDERCHDDDRDDVPHDGRA